MIVQTAVKVLKYLWLDSLLMVKVSFEIDAHEYNGRWFNEVRAWDVRPAGQAAAPTAQSVAGSL